MMMFKKMMNNMKNDESFMRDDMMSYDSMKSQYNNKYGMNEQMDMHKFEKMFDMIKSMKETRKQYDAPIASRMRSSMVPDFGSMAEFFKNSFRSKRAADTDALALNDILKEMNCMNAENEIDVRAMKKDAEQYNMPSVWFKNRYEEILDTCHEVATNLPGKLDEQEIVTGEFGTVNMGRVKSFMSCCQKSKQKLCMNQDVKNKIEENFGPVDEILDSFKYQITEDQLFTQVNQLLQGSEDEYM